MTLKITADNIDLGTLTSVTGPKITLVDYPGDDLATTPTGGATVAIAGTGFVNGCQVLVDSTYANTVTFVSSTSISFTTPAMSAGTYPIYVINPDGGTAIAIPGISYSGVPAFATSSGSLGTVYEISNFSSNISATSDSTITYTVDSGALPAGFSLNANTGAIVGNVETVTNSTTYNFTIKATDAELQDTTRSFSIATSPDVITFNTPASNQEYTNGINDSFSLALNATSTSGRSITYTANTLPTGLTLSGNLISGTLSTQATFASLITATVATSLKTATRLLTWSVTAPLPTSMEVLIVAGGGAGSYAASGGGGAGGVLYGSTSVSVGTYTITVGAGAAGSGNGYTSTASAFGGGSNSTVVKGGTTFTAYGGGVGGAFGVPPTSGSPGGSGGGTGNYNSGGGTATAGGAATQTSQGTLTGYGNNGGAGGNVGNNNPYPAGGGGGAGAVGGNATGSAGGAGGAGIANPITGSTAGQLVGGTYYVAGGGGGASDYNNNAGGVGGGGNSAKTFPDNDSSKGTAGQINTGGGGGGGSRQWFGTDGGSGVVVIAYPNDRKLASATGTYTQTNASGKYIFTFTGSGSLTF